MLANHRIAPGPASASAVAGIFVLECAHDAPRVALPRPEIHLVARIGPVARDGLDLHVLGVGERVRRKVIRKGQRVVMVRLRLGATEAVLGVPASAVAGRVVELATLWGEAPARALRDRLAGAATVIEEAAILEGAIAGRLGGGAGPSAHAALALDAASKLGTASVTAVADDLGVSDRHLRRIFQETVGLTPKTFARLTRFRRAIRAARDDARASWATIASDAGYYDQAHLIAEFRAIAGVTPRALLGELFAETA